MIDKSRLRETVSDMIGPGKVIMAMDESSGTMGKRLEAVGLEPSPNNQKAWRQLIVTTPGLTGVGAAILYEGTMDQLVGGTPVPIVLAHRGIVPGVKLDKGKFPIYGPHKENITLGLDDLDPRLTKYEGVVRFAKWRSELVIGNRTPSGSAIAANAWGLAQYAALCQQHGIVPIVEPEIIIKGSHDINRAYQVQQQVLSAVFNALYQAGVYLPGAILKPSMVTPGDKYSGGKATPQDVATATIDCFLEGGLVPDNLGGVSFLSGGLTDLDAVLYLNALNSPENRLRYPRRLTASYGRAEIGEALEEWRGDPKKVVSAQAILAERTRACGLASEGKLPYGFSYALVAQKPAA